jgi:hypothetical protein
MALLSGFWEFDETEDFVILWTNLARGTNGDMMRYVGQMSFQKGKSDGQKSKRYQKQKSQSVHVTCNHFKHPLRNEVSNNVGVCKRQVPGIRI